MGIRSGKRRKVTDMHRGLRLGLLVSLIVPAVMLAPRPAGAAPRIQTFRNSSPIAVSDSHTPPTAASPYPSTITVAGLGGAAYSSQDVVIRVKVTLLQLSHT